MPPEAAWREKGKNFCKKYAKPRRLYPVSYRRPGLFGYYYIFRQLNLSAWKFLEINRFFVIRVHYSATEWCLMAICSNTLFDMSMMVHLVYSLIASWFQRSSSLSLICTYSSCNAFGFALCFPYSSNRVSWALLSAPFLIFYHVVLFYSIRKRSDKHRCNSSAPIVPGGLPFC